MRVRTLAAGVMVSAVLLAGCQASGEEPAGLDDPTPTETAGDGGTGDDGGTGTAEPTGAPSTLPADEDWTLDVAGEPPEAPADLAVYEAYLEYWRADLEALSIPDPAHQPFLDLVIDPQRERVVSSLERMAADGVRTIGTLHLEPFVVSVSGPSAAIQDCLDARDTYDVDESGAELPDGRGGLAAVVVQLAQQGGGWVVSDVQEADHDCS
jgi:hypothetical protein